LSRAAFKFDQLQVDHTTAVIKNESVCYYVFYIQNFRTRGNVNNDVKVSTNKSIPLLRK